MRDFTDDLKEISRRLDEARGYLKIDTQRERFRELEVEVSRPDLWDDQEVAKRLNADLAIVDTGIASSPRDGMAPALEALEARLPTLLRDPASEGGGVGAGCGGGED